MSCAIFRCQSINTLSDLDNSGKHNKREKDHYDSNPDIKIEESKNNIEIVKCNKKYREKFYEVTKEYRKEHEERMKNTRSDRKKSFSRMVDDSKSCVADEMVFTSDSDFFKDMTKDEILKWANTCMDFVYHDLGYTKEQVLHATLHLDEKTPHIHCVVVPLVKKFDKRTNTERYTISKKQYIRDNIHLSELQDIYNVRLREKGYELERGIKGSNAKHQKVREFKKTTRYYENKVDIINKNLDNAMNNLEEKMKTTKNIPFDKKHVLVEKETFDSMNKVIKEAKQAIEFQPRIQGLFNEVNAFTKSHQTLEKENQNMKKEIKSLTTRNQNLTKENNNLKSYLKAILETIKHFFRKLLQIGNEKTKEATTSEIKDYYDNKDFNTNDVYDISKGTTKEDELFDYADVPSYYKTKSHNDRDKEDYEISL